METPVAEATTEVVIEHHESIFSLSDAKTWIFFSALIFAYIVWSKGKKTILQLLDSRTSRIKKELEDAEKLRQEAEKILEEYKLKQSQVMKESEEIIENAKKYAETLKHQAEEESNRITAAREQAIKERIKRAEDKAIQEINETAVKLAANAAKKILEEKMKKETSSSLIDEAIRQIPKEF